MAVRDNHSDQATKVGLTRTTINTNTTTNGAIIDTADFDMGVKYSFLVAAYTDGSYAVSFQEGNDPALADATAVPVDKVIGGALTLTAVTAAGANWAARGVHSTRRYVRCVVVSTGVTTGATLEGVATLHSEYGPVVQ